MFGLDANEFHRYQAFVTIRFGTHFKWTVKATHTMEHEGKWEHPGIHNVFSLHLKENIYFNLKTIYQPLDYEMNSLIEH